MILDSLTSETAPLEKKLTGLEEKNEQFGDVDVNSHLYDEEDPDKFSDVSSSDFSPSDIIAIVPDDIEGPALTIRMWVLAVIWASVVAGIDSFFSLRFPTIGISAIVIQILSFPCGKILERLTPKSKFNQKEHAAIYMFANIVTSAGLVNLVVIEQFKFFDGQIVGIGKLILFNMSAYITAFGLAAMSYDILVSPEDCVWPGVLGSVSLFKALFQLDNMKPFKFFGVVSSISFVWYWFPDLIAPFFSDIGAWISWIRPNNATLSQVFGVKSGLGLFPLTLDWAQVASLSNPLQTPSWCLGLVFSSFVFWIWIVLPGLYYTNKWDTGHFPIMTNKIFNKHKKPYKAELVINKNWHLNVEKYEKYSPVYLPIAFLMSLALGLASAAAVIVDFIFNYKRTVKNRQLRISYSFYLGIFAIAVGLGMGLGFFEGYKMVGLRGGGFMVSMILGGVLFLPVALVESRSSISLGMASIFDLISAFWFKGEPLTLLYFYTAGFGTLQHAMHMSQSCKVGVYMKLKKKEILIIIFAAGVWGSIVSPAVVGYVLNHIKDVCQLDAKNNMNCRKTRTQFNTHLVWGLFGNHIFAAGGRYSWVLYFFLAGGLTAIFINVMRRWKPNTIWDKIDPALVFGGAQSIPSVTGYNYSTWAAVGLFFNYWMHKRHRGWWRKYTLLLAVSIDVGLAIAAIIIYFAVVYTGGSKNFSWWGTNVSKKGCDAVGCPHLTSNITSKPYW